MAPTTDDGPLPAAGYSAVKGVVISLAPTLGFSPTRGRGVPSAVTACSSGKVNLPTAVVRRRTSRSIVSASAPSTHRRTALRSAPGWANRRCTKRPVSPVISKSMPGYRST